MTKTFKLQVVINMLLSVIKSTLNNILITDTHFLCESINEIKERNNSWFISISLMPTYIRIQIEAFICKTFDILRYLYTIAYKAFLKRFYIGIFQLIICVCLENILIRIHIVYLCNKISETTSRVFIRNYFYFAFKCTIIFQT